MAGYELAEGRYENRTLSDDEMWSAFSNLFSSHSKNSSSYKFGFLKAIMDNLYNVDENLSLTFDQLFGTFTEVYWNPLTLATDGWLKNNTILLMRFARNIILHTFMLLHGYSEKNDFFTGISTAFLKSILK